MKSLEILTLAKQAGMAGLATTVVCEIAELERFAELVAASEREACAKLCETEEVPIDIDVWMGTKKAITAATAIGLSTQIRKRSNA